MKKAPDLWKMSHTSNTQEQYTFDVAKTEEIFDFLLNEKFITFLQDRKFPSKRNLEEKYIVSIVTPEIMLLILVGVSELLSMIGSKWNIEVP